jgi:hypothetical protein
MDIDKRIEKLGSIIDEITKAIQSLMIANGAALVACLTFLKDYDTATKYKGIGTFILLFGSGLTSPERETYKLVTVAHGILVTRIRNDVECRCLFDNRKICETLTKPS